VTTNAKKTITLTIADQAISGVRLDKFIAEHLRLFTRSQLPNHELEVTVNDKKAKLSRKVSAGDSLVISYMTPEPVSYDPEPMDLDIIYENKDVVVVNKAQGIVVHPAAGNRTGTLVQGLLFYCREIGQTFDGEAIRPGIVHRLDKETSGVLIAAKHPRAQEFLAAQFRRKKTKKKYYALVKGKIAQSKGIVESRIVRDRRNRKRFTVSETDGKLAETRYQVLKSWDRYTFVSLTPITGRTHQLRVHMQHLNHPVVGDRVYGRKDNNLPDVTLMLHAYSLTIRLPGEEAPRTFRAVLPGRFARAMQFIDSMQIQDW
jgi:23S rRNA pseudouridine1911/1915/1917 synthase